MITDQVTPGSSSGSWRRYPTNLMTSLWLKLTDSCLLMSHARGQRGAHDLLVAATAGATRRKLGTTDRRANFQDLPEA